MLTVKTDYIFLSRSNKRERDGLFWPSLGIIMLALQRRIGIHEASFKLILKKKSPGLRNVVDKALFRKARSDHPGPHSGFPSRSMRKYYEPMSSVIVKVKCEHGVMKLEK